jgi:hypothetical protein
MTIIAHQGPIVSFGQGDGTEYNPERGPSLFDQGHGYLDGRSFFNYNPGQNFGSLTAGWMTVTNIQTMNITPVTLSSTALATAQTVTSGTAMVLSTSTGIVTATVISVTSGLAVTNLYAVGQAAGRVSFGSAGTIQMWDPTTMTARVLSIGVSNATTTSVAFKVSGFDIYGVQMDETITISSATISSGKKAWKYIQSVTPQGSDSVNSYSVGTTDTYGFPLATLNFGDVLINYNSILLTTNTSYLAAVSTIAGATTGDIRGTFVLPSAANGTKPLYVYQTPTLLALQTPTGVAGTSTVQSMFGVPQF